MKSGAFLSTLLILVATASCETVDDRRLPDMPVNISLSDIAMWNTYGVSGFGSSRRFIRTDNEREPRSFPFTTSSATGFGGVLLISGLDPASGLADMPLAYDLACPVECTPSVRVTVDPDTYEAVCMKCGSVYDVTVAGGAPLSGPAASSHYGLKKYSCIPTGNGGYIITN